MSEVSIKIAHEKWVSRDWHKSKRKIYTLACQARFEYEYAVSIRELNDARTWNFKRFNWI